MNSDSNSQVLKVVPSRNLLVLRLALFCLFICALVFMAFSIGWNSLPLLHQVVLLAAPLFVCWNVFQMIRAIRTRPVWMQLGPDGVALSGEQMVSWERLKPIRWSFLKNALLFQDTDGRRWQLHRVDFNKADMDRVVAFLQRSAPPRLTASL